MKHHLLQRWVITHSRSRRRVVHAVLAALMLCACLVQAVLAAPSQQGGGDPASGSPRRLRRAEPTPDAAPVMAAPRQTDLKYSQYLPAMARQPSCPAESSRSYALLEVSGPTTDRPAELHADLNLGLRGWAPVSEPARLVYYNGGTDSDPPRLASLFSGSSEAAFGATYRVYDWDWSCGTDGCRSPDFAPGFPVSLLGLKTEPGQPVYMPARNQHVSGSSLAMVLYADDRRITLKYTLEDNVVSGYTVHLEDVCVDPELLQLYRTYKDMPYRPGLDMAQPLGTAYGDELKVAIRDSGAFMDPRSGKDWWWNWP